MSIKDLEQYEETGRRTPMDFDAPDQQETKEEEQIRLSRIDKNRERVHIPYDIKTNEIERDVEEALQEETDNRDDSIIDTLDYLTYDER